MGALIRMIKGFFSTIGSLIDFIVSFFQDLVYIIKLFADLVIQLPSMIGWLPTTVISLLVTAFGILVILRVLGRDG